MYAYFSQAKLPQILLDSEMPQPPPQGTTYDVGDIVSVLDRDGGVYYAIVRGFLQDQYAAKYATLTWLLPTRPNPSYFDPSIFVIGE